LLCPAARRDRECQKVAICGHRTVQGKGLPLRGKSLPAGLAIREQGLRPSDNQ
jgi:hypothetical protein